MLRVGRRNNVYKFYIHISRLIHTEDQLKEQYKNLTVQYIREKYSANQEFAVIREYVAYGEPYKEAFDEYSNYVESCKERAHAAVYV